MKFWVLKTGTSMVVHERPLVAREVRGRFRLGRYKEYKWKVRIGICYRAH